MTPLQILQSARKRISDPAIWGKGTRPQDRPLTTCCIAEAIEEAWRTGGEPRYQAFNAVFNAAGLDRHIDAITTWNDAPERTHDEVLKTLDLAIALVR